MLLKIDPLHPQTNFIKRVVEILRNGGAIAYPTDTVYGIGCDFTNRQAVERIYRLKNLSRHKPLSFICQDLKDISLYALVSNTAYKIMKRLLPGPYTFVLRATRQVPRMMITNQRTVGIRVPLNEICLELARGLGSPIISTSAAVHEDDVISDPVEIDKKFGASLDLVIDGGILASDPSSIVDLTEERPRVLREGKGSLDLFFAKP